MALAERFWSKVSKDGPVLRPDLGPCWTWAASKTPDGYGKLWGGGKSSNTRRAHRVAWELEHGADPGSLLVLHKCDGGALGCVRPDHLFLGSVADNSADMVAKGRQCRGERNPNARLSDADVAAIRESTERPAALARRFGVQRTSIWAIRTGRRRK